MKIILKIFLICLILFYAINVFSQTQPRDWDDCFFFYLDSNNEIKPKLINHQIEYDSEMNDEPPDVWGNIISWPSYDEINIRTVTTTHWPSMIFEWSAFENAVENTIGQWKEDDCSPISTLNFYDCVSLNEAIEVKFEDEEIFPYVPNHCRYGLGLIAVNADNEIIYESTGGNTSISKFEGNLISKTQALLNNAGWLKSEYGKEWTLDNPAGNTDKVHVQSILLHELGHTLGLGHCGWNGSIMDNLGVGKICNVCKEDRCALQYLDNKDIGIDESIPIDFSLTQNYPNPFNAYTTIHYEIPVRINLDISIYNVLGQKVKTLFNNNRFPGFYKISWNGCDDSDFPLGTGIYFIKFSSTNFNSTTKMMLLK